MGVRRQLLLAIGVSALFARTFAGAQTEQVVDRVVRAAVSETGPGVAVMVSIPKQAPFAKGYGLANVAKRAKIQTTSLFDLASVSKPLTSLTILSLVDQGRISLDSPIARVVTDFKVPAVGRAITIRDLLQHTSGLQDYTDDFEGSDAQFARLTPQTHVAWLNKTRVKSAPGRAFEYSN